MSHLGRQHLKCHVAAEFRVGGAIHLAHAARAERRKNLVGSQAGSGGQGHGCRTIVLCGSLNYRGVIPKPGAVQPGEGSPMPEILRSACKAAPLRMTPPKAGSASITCKPLNPLSGVPSSAKLAHGFGNPAR